MIKLTCSIFISSIIFFIIFFTYIKMSKNSLAKYYQENRDYKKKAHKSNNIVANNVKIYKNMKNKGLFSIEKNIMKWEKTSHNYKTLLFFKKYWLRKVFWWRID